MTWVARRLFFPILLISNESCLWVMFQNSIREESHLAMETSGHGALKENHWLDDGAYLMVRSLFESSIWKLSSLIHKECDLVYD